MKKLTSVKRLTLPPPIPGKTGWPWIKTQGILPVLMTNGSSWPKISVVTPSYNQGQFIEETIRSVLQQDYPNLEFIVIDGGSTDNTLEVIKNYEPWLAYWESEPDRGQSHAINKGIEKASGELLLWLNADDLVLPGAFKKVVKLFCNNQDLALIVGQAILIDSESLDIGKINSYFLTWEEAVTNPQNSIRQISTFFRRNLFDKYGGIDESLHLSMDSDILIRFTQYHLPLVIDDYLTAFRVHPQAKSYKDILSSYKESDRVRKKYLKSKDLKKQHHIRSAQNWLNLSEMSKFKISDRIACLKNSALHNPYRVLTLEFIRSLWKIIKSVVRKNIHAEN